MDAKNKKTRRRNQITIKIVIKSSFRNKLCTNTEIFVLKLKYCENGWPFCDSVCMSKHVLENYLKEGAARLALNLQFSNQTHAFDDFSPFTVIAECITDLRITSFFFSQSCINKTHIC